MSKELMIRSEALIEAIDNNTICLKDLNREENDLFITQRFISDELEDLRVYLIELKKGDRKGK